MGKFKHGMAFKNKATSAYRSYTAMMSHCYYPKNSQFKNYGGRGITVCDRWRSNAAQFLKDMGEKPLGTTLGRINNELGYSPENCRWETIDQQANNRRNNKPLTFEGITLNIAQWERKLSLPTDLIQRRITQYGWTIERALTTPVLDAKFKKKTPALDFQKK